MKSLPTVDSKNSDHPQGIWALLKRETQPVHARLDARITQAKPFQNLDRYERFLLVQHDFHQLVSPLYQHDDLERIVPGLKSRDRLQRIEQDLADLDICVQAKPTSTSAAELDIPNMLGWLYVAEGSNLGAAILLKEAEKLGLSDAFGARHLAAATEGRGLHWKTFTAALDTINLSASEQKRAIEGANNAFAAVLEMVTARFAAEHFESEGRPR